MNKAILNLCCIIVFFTSVEFISRKNAYVFYALGDKFFLKIELLKRRKNNKIIFIGTSRTQDSVDSNFVQRWFEQERSKTVKVFNGGVPASNFLMNKYFLEQSIKMEQSATFLVEISEGSLKTGDFKPIPRSLDKLETASPRKYMTIEESLRTWVRQQFYFVKYRKSLSFKAFMRLFFIGTSDTMVHDLWFRSGTLRQLTTGFYKKADLEKIKVHSALSLAKEGRVRLLKSVKGGDGRVEKIIELYKIVSSHNRKVVFFIPPVMGEARTKECLEDNNGLKSALFSYRKKIQILDYSCSKPLPIDFFKDEKHLSPTGRVYFSQLISYDLSQILEF